MMVSTAANPIRSDSLMACRGANSVKKRRNEGVGERRRSAKTGEED